jgi:uncharacterized Ntn-hydrolase superfamily protein
VTYSLVAADPQTGEVGAAVQSKYFAVGAVVPWAKAGVGAVATQAAGVAAYGPRILALLEQRVDPAAAVAATLAEDAERETRQLGVVAADGLATSMTGERCGAWAGSVVGDGYAAQGNLLAGEAVVADMARAFEAASGSLAERLLAGLEAAQAAGGDRRGQQSAALMVERRGAAGESRDGLDRVVDLRVDDHAEPIVELRRLFGIQQRWDALRQASGSHAAREYRRGIRILEDALERFPDEPALLYDLACFESLEGEASSALAHLRRAVELDAGYRSAARADEDFTALRNLPEFRRLAAPDTT